jgi:hypothetical protein
VLSVCLSIDCWTSRNAESYLAVTAHFITQEFKLMLNLLECASMDLQHTSVNLAAEVKRIKDKFCLSHKVLVVVTDNAANITNEIKTELGWKHFGCFAHTLNLIVQEALKSTKCVLDKVKIIVAHFKRSTIESDKLLLYQKNQGVAVPEKLIQEFPTRWNSTFHMLQHITELKDAVIALINKNLPVLSEDEWQICCDLTKILKPFEEFTAQLSGQQYVTGSQVIVITRDLVSVCGKLLKDNINRALNQVIKDILSGINSRCCNFEFSKTIALCTFLDPRFKLLGFSDPTAAESTKKFAIELVTKAMNQQQSVSALERPEPSTSTAKQDNSCYGYSVWDDSDKRVATSQRRGKSKYLTIYLFNYFMLVDLKIYTRPVITSYLYFTFGTTTSAAITCYDYVPLRLVPRYE